MTEDPIVIGSAAVTVAFLIMSAVLLSRYRQISSSLRDSRELAKDLWDATEMRLSKQDQRIVDLMARVEVYGARAARGSEISGVAYDIGRRETKDVPEHTSPITGSVESVSEFASTERRVLRVLESGAKSSTEINKLIGRSREHTARLMKNLFERGYVTRDDAERPFVYRITDEGKRYLGISD